MSIAPRTLLTTVAVLAAGLGAGWVLMGQLERTVPVLPGTQGCWRLDGAARQVACLSDELEAEAGRAAAGRSGVEREQAVIAYVRGVERAAAGDERLAGSCHQAMHQLGRSEGARAAGSKRVPTFPGAATQLCTAGYVHGLAEGYLTGTPTAEVAAVYPALCHDAAARDGCAHGVGHALLRGQGDAEPLRGADRAAGRCMALPQDARSHCHNGVYMELAMRSEPAPVSPDAYIRTCRSLEDDLDRGFACWSYLPVNLTSNDVPAAAMPDWCSQASVPGQLRCIEAYGRQLGARDVASCGSTGRDVVVQRCIEGAISLAVGSGHVDVDDAADACAAFERRDLARYCMGATARYDRGRAAVEASGSA